MNFDVLIIGGGAAGFFTAINCAQAQPNLSIAILERGGEVLEKVRVSGGGRCNVTHAVFEPKPLTQFYPRGDRELLGPFHSFMSGDTMEWFDNLGVSLKIEEDGRVFPVSNNSQTIIDCFLKEAQKYRIEILKKSSVTEIKPFQSGWEVYTKSSLYTSSNLVVATGSNPKMLKVLENLNFEVVSQVPSLFTFNITDKRIKNLSGLSTDAVVTLLDLEQKPLEIINSPILKDGAQGPVLITHWGLSGPGILKLSAWAARLLKDLDYEFYIQINWLPNLLKDEVYNKLVSFRIELARQHISTHSPFDIPKRLWQSLVEAAYIEADRRWADITGVQLRTLSEELSGCVFRVSGKSTFKEEFVTAGGIDLKEINFKTFESKKFQNLYLVGEVLNIDAITGGFNFQNAWTGGYLAAQAIAAKFQE